MEAKKIIVTGGANRIGRSIALELASYDTQIVIHYSKSYFAAKKLNSKSGVMITGSHNPKNYNGFKKP